MARARNIKPGFFQNENLVEYPFEVRLLFIGLWTLADKKGRLEDRPKKIKMGVFPADDVNVENGLALLEADKFIDRYEVDGVKYIQISNWEKHQSPHHTEKDSVIPPLSNSGEPVKPQKQDGGNPPDSLIHRFTDSPIQKTVASTRASTDPQSPSPGGAASARMRQAGLADANPSHPKLLALLAAGITLDELWQAASEAVQKKKGFAYALALAEGRRRDATTAPLPSKGESKQAQLEARNAAVAAAWVPPEMRGVAS